MTATNSPTSPTELSAEQKAHEPSMDDILASIRRLISDDDALPLSRRARASARSRVLATPAEVSERGPAAEQAAPPRDAFFGLVQRLGRHSSAPAPEQPSQPEPGHEPSVSPPPASVIAKTPALKLRDFALKNFVTRPDPDAPVEPERAPNVAAQAASFEITPVASSAPLAAEVLRPSLPTTEEPAQAPAAPVPEPQPARQMSSVVSLPMRPAPSLEARSKIPPLPLRAPIFAPPPAEPVAEPTQETPQQAPEEPALLSPANDAKVAAAFEALAASLLARDKDLLDRVARELLRPMLKDWLDDNLPGLVERLVCAEIERIARGRG